MRALLESDCGLGGPGRPPRGLRPNAGPGPPPPRGPSSRRGKSRHAIDVARRHGTNLAFIATAPQVDEEWRDRIALHRRERGPEFTTFEEPLAVASLIHAQAASFDATVVDCLTLWIHNL